MNDGNVQTIEQVSKFLGGSEALEFNALSVGEKCQWIEDLLIRFTESRSRHKFFNLQQLLQALLLPPQSSVCQTIRNYVSAKHRTH